MNRPTAILLGVLLIGAGVVFLVIRVRIVADQPGVMPIAISSLGVACLLGGFGMIGTALKGAGVRTGTGRPSERDNDRDE